jgi:hypothetical protein
MGDGAEKVVTFFNNISQTKNSVEGGLNRAFFLLFEASKRGWQKAVETRLYKGKD